MVIPLSALMNPGASFDEPLDILAACHSRLEDQCALLRKVVIHVNANGADSSAREAADSIIRFFDQAADHHHQDEETDLFPAMLANAGPCLALIDGLVQSINQEHVLLRRAWKWQLRPQLLALSDGLEALQPESIEAFADLYQRHVHKEERELLPLARDILGPEVLRELGERMAARRRES